jgi:hypothetical protein
MEKRNDEFIKNYILYGLKIKDDSSMEFYEDDMNYLYELKIKGHPKYSFFIEMGLSCFVKSYDSEENLYH